MRNREWLCERAILAPTNEIVGQINERMMSHVQGDVVEYLSVHIIMDSEQVTSYPTEFLNSLELSGVPSHKLRLKVGVPVLLMRYLEAPRLCNGTRLQITQLGRNIIRAIIMTGIAKDEEVLIPRIPMIPTDLPFQFKRIQFPLKPAFAMTINKAQGQTLKVAGVNLEKNCFSHGQLYVACSRVSNPKNLHILSNNNKTANPTSTMSELTWSSISIHGYDVLASNRSDQPFRREWSDPAQQKQQMISEANCPAKSAD
ncbi:uncharacterized protein LOC111361126 [Spodoptera litura]|uniref:Uncharacterized protein LOC111361126 n=1 Tax=Spodoptera litura TaxID=69820 RepID=A0A9J7EMQ9_SPOLT|nr:uncharacterized protein LOC111361126 [Spodoptera litura]